MSFTKSLFRDTLLLSADLDKITHTRRDIMTENEIGTIVVDGALKIHKALGPGLLEVVYEAILARQLEKSGLATQRQVMVPINFEGVSNTNINLLAAKYAKYLVSVSPLSPSTAKINFSRSFCR